MAYSMEDYNEEIYREKRLKKEQEDADELQRKIDNNEPCDHCGFYEYLIKVGTAKTNNCNNCGRKLLVNNNGGNMKKKILIVEKEVEEIKLVKNIDNIDLFLTPLEFSQVYPLLCKLQIFEGIFGPSDHREYETLSKQINNYLSAVLKVDVCVSRDHDTKRISLYIRHNFRISIMFYESLKIKIAKKDYDFINKQRESILYYNGFAGSGVWDCQRDEIDKLSRYLYKLLNIPEMSFSTITIKNELMYCFGTDLSRFINGYRNIKDLFLLDS